MRAATVVQVLQDLFYVLLHVFYLWSLLYVDDAGRALRRWRRAAYNGQFRVDRSTPRSRTTSVVYWSVVLVISSASATRRQYSAANSLTLAMEPIQTACCVLFRLGRSRRDTHQWIPTKYAPMLLISVLFSRKQEHLRVAVRPGNAR